MRSTSSSTLPPVALSAEHARVDDARVVEDDEIAGAQAARASRRTRGRRDACRPRAAGGSPSAWPRAPARSARAAARSRSRRGGSACDCEANSSGRTGAQPALRRVLVPGGGIEPPRCRHRRILSPLRLPVPSSRRWDATARCSCAAKPSLSPKTNPWAIPNLPRSGRSAKRPMSAVRNVLFVMCDQLRRDHLSCYGGRVPTPNLDALAARGVCFDNAYVQSGVCGPSRMSFYTGRYMSSHGATWNSVPLSVAQPTLGDYLRAAGRSVALAGKSHVIADERRLRTLRHRARIRSAARVARRRIRRGRPLRRPYAAGTRVGLRRLPARARLCKRRPVDASS